MIWFPCGGLGREQKLLKVSVTVNRAPGSSRRFSPSLAHFLLSLLADFSSLRSHDSLVSRRLSSIGFLEGGGSQLG